MERESLRSCANFLRDAAVAVIGFAVFEYSFCNFLVDFMSRSAAWVEWLLGNVDDHDLRLLFHVHDTFYCAIVAPKKHIENNGLALNVPDLSTPEILCRRNSFTIGKKTNVLNQATARPFVANSCRAIGITAVALFVNRED